MVLSRSQTVSWQCYITLFRVFTALYMIGHLIWMVVFIWYLKRTEHEGGVNYADYAAKFGGWIGFAVILLLNDLFMAIIDLKRTNTYLGCIAVQLAANCCFTGLIAAHLVFWELWAQLFSDILHDLDEYPQFVPFLVFALLSGVCSLCLLVINVCQIYTLRSSVSMGNLWRINTKDALRETVVPLIEFSDLSMFGRPRDSPIKTHANIQRFMARLLFRRVRPVESLKYAFVRNAFAIGAIGALIFRTTTALLSAQNEIETRVAAADCQGRATEYHNIGILVDHIFTDPNFFNPSSPTELEISINLSVVDLIGRNYHLSNTTNCTVAWSDHTQTLKLYFCSRLSISGFSKSMLVHHIEILSKSRAPSDQILNKPLPRFWLINLVELPSNITSFEVGEVQEFQPGWELLRGTHIEAEAKLITRRLITSSIMKDIVLNSEPDYRALSLYPITESVVTPLINSSGNTVATATVRNSLAPGLMAFRRQGGSRIDYLQQMSMCDFIDDYRTSTILDVLGSVGGLFALLQAIHVLLFGRPLFWGLTGAKLISPFGLFGSCSSREFKRRLRDEYHDPSPADPTQTFRTVKFLQDFVMDFGPVDPNPDSQPPSPGNTTNFANIESQKEDRLHAKVKSATL